MSHSFFTTGIINAISISRHSSARTLFLFVPLAGPVPFLTLHASSRRLSPSVSLESSNQESTVFPERVSHTAFDFTGLWVLLLPQVLHNGSSGKRAREFFSFSVSSARMIFRDASTVADYPFVKTYVRIDRVFCVLGFFFRSTRLVVSVSAD